MLIRSKTADSKLCAEVHATRIDQPEGGAICHVSPCKGVQFPPFDPPFVRLCAASETSLGFHASGACALLTANDGLSFAVRRSGSQKRRRRRHIDVCCDDAEFVLIDDKARTAGMSLASYLRACAIGSPGPRASRSPVD